jgi:phospholipid/cholesterol/gamma-HCH transport system substrate-binding protein
MPKLSTANFGTGLFLVLGFSAILFLTMQTRNSAHSDSSYALIARFENIGGLRVGSPVRIAGVKVGVVSGIDIDQTTSRAAVSLRIDPKYRQIPEDSSAGIFSRGLLGGRYIAIIPGSSSNVLQDKDELIAAKSAVAIEELFKQLPRAAANALRRR